MSDRITFRLPARQADRLADLATARRTTVTALIQEAVARLLDDQAEIDRLAALENRLVSAIQAASAETARCILENLEVAP